MKKRERNILAAFSIITGLLVCLIYLFNHFFIDYFSAIGARESASAFLLGLLLLIGGVIIFINESLGKYLILGYIIGNLIDRVLVLLLYYEYTSIDIFMLPLIGSTLMGYVYFFTARKIISMNSKYALLLGVLLVLIILLPKFS